MSATTESPFSLTIKVGPNNDLLTGRADTAEEMLLRVQQLHQIASSMQGVAQTITQTVAPVQQAAPTVEQAVQNLANGGITGTVVQSTPSGIEVRDDQWGNTYTRGNPDTGTCAHGPRIAATKTNAQGRVYKAYVCVNDSPFREGKFNKAEICKMTFPSKG